MVNILIMDCAPRNENDEFAQLGFGTTGDLEARMLKSVEPSVKVSIICASLDDNLAKWPSDDDLIAFDGVLISGSPLSVTQEHSFFPYHMEGLERITNIGLPIFGICYGLQLTAQFAGGEVIPNPAV